jgi:hypothetical protein
VALKRAVVLKLSILIGRFSSPAQGKAILPVHVGMGLNLSCLPDDTARVLRFHGENPSVLGGASYSTLRCEDHQGGDHDSAPSKQHEQGGWSYIEQVMETSHSFPEGMEKIS